MPYIIRVYFNNRIYSIDLTKIANATIGSDSADTITLEAYGLSRNHIRFVESRNKVYIKGKGLITAEGFRTSSDELSCGKRYSLQTEPEINIAVHPKQKDTDKTIGLLNIEQITIGRSSKNDVVLKNMRTSGEHCVIYRKGGSYTIKDKDSKNGTYVNEVRVSEKTLNDGDVINISIYQIVLKNNTLCFYNTGDDFELNMKDTKPESKPADPIAPTDPNELPKMGEGTISLFNMTR